jgi:hypothetical protein
MLFVQFSHCLTDYFLLQQEYHTFDESVLFEVSVNHTFGFHPCNSQMLLFFNYIFFGILYEEGPFYWNMLASIYARISIKQTSNEYLIKLIIKPNENHMKFFYKLHFISKIDDGYFLN